MELTSKAVKESYVVQGRKVLGVEIGDISVGFTYNVYCLNTKEDAQKKNKKV